MSDMKLTTSSGAKIVNPSDEQIREALSVLGVGRDDEGWAVLMQTEMDYVQVSGDRTSGFAMEYQTGDTDRHYRAARENFALEQVVRAFADYRDGTIDYSAYGDWSRITW
jgi:hypothetical protein